MAKQAKPAAEDVSKKVEGAAKEAGEKADGAAEDASKTLQDKARYSILKYYMFQVLYTSLNIAGEYRSQSFRWRFVGCQL